MKKKILSGILAVCLSMPAWSQRGSSSSMMSPYSQYGLGVLADQSQAVSRGMGGTGIAMRGGTQVNTLNPAAYSAVDSLTMLFDVGLSGRFSNFKENGSRLNARNADFDYAVGLFRMRQNLGVSFGLLPFSDIGYSYTSSAPLSGAIGNLTESYIGSGGLHQAFVGAGWRPFDHFSVGFNLAFLWGNYSRSVISAGSSSSSVNTLSKNYTADISSYNLSLGVQWQQPLDRQNELTVGATFGLGHKLGADPACDIINTNTSTQLSDTTSFTIHNGLQLPVSLGVGLAWTYKGRLSLAADYTLQRWGSVDFPSYNQSAGKYQLRSDLLCDRSRVGMGVDYVPNPSHQRHYLKRVHYRMGVSYATPYYKINGQDGPAELSVGAGLGLPLLNKWESRSVVNISAQWVRTSAKDLITDNTFRINVGLTFNERWFAKWRVD